MLADDTPPPSPTATNPYYNGDLMLSSVLNYLQYPIPMRIRESANHYIDFSQAQPALSSANSWADEIRFVAAWKFCEHLTPDFPPPVYGGSRTLTMDDLNKITVQRNTLALKSAAMNECFAAVAYRTACPATALDSFAAVGAADGCNAVQTKMCQRLYNAPGASPISGLGITKITKDGTSDADHALYDCIHNGAGLSPAMYDKIFAYRCDSDTYVQQTLSQLDASTLQHVQQFECNEAKAAFDAKLDRERERLLIALQTLVEVKKIGIPQENRMGGAITP